MRLWSIDASPQLAAIRKRVFDEATELFLVLGAVGLVAILVRDLVRGAGLVASIVPALALTTFGILHRLRDRTGVHLRIAVYLGLLLAQGVSGILAMGVRSPGAIWFVVAAVQAWVLVGGRRAWWVTGLAGLSFALAAGFVLVRGAASVAPGDELTGNAWFWAVQAIALLLATILLFQSVRELVLGVASLEREVRHRRDRLRSILDGIDDALVLWSVADGAIVEANRTARTLLGVVSGGRMPTVGLRFASSRGAWSSERFAKRIAVAALAGDSFTWCCRRADGVEFWGEVAVSAVTGSPSGDLLISVRDIGERIRRHLDLEALNRRLEARVEDRTRHLDLARRELASFSYSVAHDLRGPLRVMSGFARILQEDCGKDMPASDRSGADAIIALAGELSGRLDELLAPYLEMSRRSRTEEAENP